MKIAVAAQDESTLAPHFGRSWGFLIYEVSGGRILNREIRLNTFTGHARGQHGHHGHDHGHGQQHGVEGHHGHSHADLVSALADCAYVLCRGMGGRALVSLKESGIRPLMVPNLMEPEQAVKAFLAENASLREPAPCRHPE